MPPQSPPPPIATTTVARLRHLLEQLEADRALPRQDVGMIERRHEHCAVLGGEDLRSDDAVVDGGPAEDHLGAVRPGGADLGDRRRCTGM